MHYVIDIAFWGAYYEEHGQLCCRKVSLIPIMHFSKCITKRKGLRLDFRAGLGLVEKHNVMSINLMHFKTFGVYHAK